MHHAKQQARKKRPAASGNTLPPKQLAQRCPAKGGAKRSAHHYATDFYAKLVLPPGEKRGQQFLVLSSEELEEQREQGSAPIRLNFTLRARGIARRVEVRPLLHKLWLCERRGQPACPTCTITPGGVRHCCTRGHPGHPRARTHTHTRIPGSLNRAKRRSRNRKVVGSIPGAGMSGGGRRQPCVKGILSGEIAK